MKLDNKRVLIIGGSSGIGLATAMEAATRGARVTVASRSLEKLNYAATINGNAFETSQVDTTSEENVARFFERSGAWDHIVVSAAQTPTGGVKGLELKNAYSAMDSKFWGAYRVAHLGNLVKGGSLTFISGFLSVRPSVSAVLQGAINAGLEALARGLALELAPCRVNTVSPGMVDTPLWSGMPTPDRAALFAKVSQNLPVGRVGSPNDIAEAVIFLMLSPFATGSTVRVDGGGAIA